MRSLIHQRLCNLPETARLYVCKTHLHRCLATSTNTVSTSKNEDNNYKSKRIQFREIAVHPSIKKYIEMIGVGIPSRGKGSRLVRKSLFDAVDGRRSGRTGSLMIPPPPFSVGDKARRRVTIVGSVTAAEETRFPRNLGGIPEVAIAGRSNVGKSTLLNALLYGNQPSRNSKEGVISETMIRQYRRGRTPENVKLPKGVKAKTSGKPGETRAITFYQLSAVPTQQGNTTKNNGTDNPNNKEDNKEILLQQRKLRLVDLPGYGFSFNPKDHDSFRELLLQYLLERGKVLKRILLLIDGRHGLKKADFDFLNMLQEAALKKQQGEVPAIQVVLTKCDLVPRDDLARRIVLVRQQLSDTLRRETSSLPVLLVSARAGVGFNNMKKGQYRAKGGVLELQKELAALVPK